MSENQQTSKITQNKGYHKFTVNLDSDEWNQLNLVSEKYGTPKSRIIRNTIRQSFNLQYT